jgi:heme-degrading monooxygenase HmoA
MYCLATRYQADPANLDEVTRIFKEEEVPLASSQPGYKGAYLLAKPSGIIMIMNMWDTEEQANAWPQNPKNQEIAARIRSLLSGLRSTARDGYDVRVQA